MKKEEPVTESLDSAIALVLDQLDTRGRDQLLRSMLESKMRDPVQNTTSTMTTAPTQSSSSSSAAPIGMCNSFVCRI